jgi:DnaK suppressor protein
MSAARGLTAVSRRTADADGDGHLDPETIREAERLLRARLDQLQASVRSVVGEQRATEAERAADMNVAASATLLEEIQVTLVDRRGQQIAQIEGALDRLSRGQYGFCQECREFIGLPRLRALPFAQRCRPCQSVAERRGPGAPPQSTSSPRLAE